MNTRILKQASVYHTIQNRIEYALRYGVKLTQKDANQWPFYTSRLGAFIFKLRKKGCPIITVRKSVECGDGHIASVAEYSWSKKK